MFSQCILSLFTFIEREIRQYWNTAMFLNIDFRSCGTVF